MIWCNVEILDVELGKSLYKFIYKHSATTTIDVWNVTIHFLADFIENLRNCLSRWLHNVLHCGWDDVGIILQSDWIDAESYWGNMNVVESWQVTCTVDIWTLISRMEPFDSHSSMACSSPSPLTTFVTEWGIISDMAKIVRPTRIMENI